MMHDLGNAIGSFISTMFILLCIFLPLGLWKLIEIIVWICKHVSISFGG